MKPSFLVLLLLIGFSYSAASQQPIKLMNPSFEDPSMDQAYKSINKPLCCKSPRGWYSCGGLDLNTPDSQPGNFGVTLPAIHGEFHLGLVTRDNDTWEGISQRLKGPIYSQSSYFFSLAIAKSNNIISDSRRTGKVAKYYERPTKLRIYGGNGYCQKLELLAETESILNTKWEYHNFILKPTRIYGYLTIEVFYKTPSPVPYNGNILLDDLSPIIPIQASTEDIISKIKKERRHRALNFDPEKRREANLKRDSLQITKTFNYADSITPNPTITSIIPEIDHQESLKKKVEDFKKFKSNNTKEPISWEPILYKITNTKYQLYFNATIQKDWKLFSLTNKDLKGERGVKIELASGNHFMVTNDLVESTNYKIEYDDSDKSDIRYYESDASFGNFLLIFNERKPIFGTISYEQKHEDGVSNYKSLKFMILPETDEIFFK